MERRRGVGKTNRLRICISELDYDGLVWHGSRGLLSSQTHHPHHHHLRAAFVEMGVLELDLTVDSLPISSKRNADLPTQNGLALFVPFVCFPCSEAENLVP